MSLLLDSPGGTGRSDVPRKKATLDVLREAMETEEPALALDAIEGRVPFNSLVHAGDGAHDERIEAAPDVALPARHGSDVGLHGGVAVGLRDLRVTAGEESRLREGPLGGGLFLRLSRTSWTSCQPLCSLAVDLVACL